MDPLTIRKELNSEIRSKRPRVVWDLNFPMEYTVLTEGALMTLRNDMHVWSEHAEVM